MGILALDGVKDFQKVMGSCKERSIASEEKDIYFRVTVIVQAVLCLVKACVLQVCRAAMFLAAGRFREGGRDLASVAVQFVALPCLGIAAIISPVHARGFANKLARHDVTRIGNEKTNQQNIEGLSSVSETLDKVSRGVGGFLAVFVAGADRGCATLSKLLARDWKNLELEKTAKNIGFGTLFTASLGTLAAFKTESSPEDLLGRLYFVNLPAPQPAPGKQESLA